MGVHALERGLEPAGAKLSGVGETGAGDFGVSAALSGGGNTALIGGLGDHGNVGAAWVFTPSAGLWSQQGPELTGAGETGSGQFGWSVALSGDGNTALIGALSDSSGAGFGWSVALSSNGNTALVGGAADHGNFGAARAFTRSGATWSQQGAKLVGDCTGSGGTSGSGESGEGEFGEAVALSADGTTALIGAPDDNSSVGAAWVFTQPEMCADVAASTPPGGGAVSISLSCSAPPGASLAYAIASPPAHGALQPINQSTGQITYISLPGYVGTDASPTSRATASAPETSPRLRSRSCRCRRPARMSLREHDRAAERRESRSRAGDPRGHR